MRVVPQRNPVLVLGCVFTAFVAGPVLGAAVAQWTAPGSELAQLVGPLAFVLTFVGGLVLWFGAGLVSLVGSAFHRLVRGRWKGDPLARQGEEIVPPGYGVFVPLGIGLGLLAGAVAGVAAEPGSFWTACAAHTGAAAAYGAALRMLAQQGYLPFPEPS